MTILSDLCFFFFFNDTATTEIYTLSLHDALPISFVELGRARRMADARIHRLHKHPRWTKRVPLREPGDSGRARSEEHTSELQSQSNLVCRLLLEKKNKKKNQNKKKYKINEQDLST